MAFRLEKEEVCPSSPQDASSMTMVIFTLSLVERGGGDHGISCKEKKVCSSYSKDEEKDDHGYLTQQQP